MKSVLLGGLKVFLTNDGGFPLSAPGGRAKFFTAGTSTPETVYSDIDLTEGTALGPVVYTDELGALPPVWLKTDRLYKVIVEQKVSDDPEVWATLWEVDNVGTYVPTSAPVAGDPSAVVTSISALKAVDHGEHGTVVVLGYYTPGDWGTPSTFVYDAESTASADDGALVEPNDHVGRWVQVFSGDVLDVRKFGAIPDLTENSDVTAKVVNAVNYAQRNSTRSRPLTVAFLAPGKYEFVGDFDFTQYADFVDLSDNSHHKLNWLIGEDVVFKGDNSDFTLSSNTVCLTREALIEGTSVTLSIEGGGSIVVDPVWWGSTSLDIEDCYVECHSATSNNKKFTRCSIVSNGFLDGYVRLINSGFKESWFVSGYDFSKLLVSDAFMGTVYDCESADSYIDIKNIGAEPDYGDLGGMTITGKTLLSGCTIENAVFDGVHLSGDATLRNVRGSFDIEVGAELTLVDCELEISDSIDIDELYIKGGSIGRQHSDSEKITVRNTLIADRSEINVNVLYYGDSLSLVKCEILKSFTQYDNSAKIDGDIISCVWHAAHVIDPQTADTVVNIKWIDNIGVDSGYVSVNSAGNLKSSDDQHGYVYEGNRGSFLPMEASHSVTIDSADVSISTYSGSIAQGKINICNQNVTLESTGDYVLFITGVELNPSDYETSIFTLGCAVEKYECDFTLYWAGDTGEYYNSTTHSSKTSLKFRFPFTTVFHVVPNDTFLAGYWKALMNLNNSETHSDVIMEVTMRRIR